ncbi:carbohydrate-binding module family 50 protein [Xylariaceae sp. FL1272]|nr:carbohydrate-binding module family 50 protein [Xylariaceae sp. FL1272]
MLSKLIFVALLPLTLGYLVDPPSPAPSNTIVDCSNWYQVTSSSDSCEDIAAGSFITLDQLYSYNPSLSAKSCALILNDSYCVEENFGTAPPTTTSSTTTTTGNGISTPMPVQTGIASNCNRFYLVKEGDACGDIADTYGITLQTFYTWNPAVGSTCKTLLAGDYVCVGTLSSTVTTTTTSKPTTTTPGNGISTPTPVQTGIVGNCNRFYLVQEGDVCDDIVATYGIPLANFYTWNPAVGSTCKSLLAGDYVCVGVIGSTTTTTTTKTTTTTTSPTTTLALGNGIATPTPTQAGMVTNCDSFHLVVSGDTCATVAAAAGISTSNFYAWNPAVGGSACQSLQANTYACIGVQTCTTNANGLIVPKPAGAVCGTKAVSNGGTTLVSYSSGTPVSNINQLFPSSFRCCDSHLVISSFAGSLRTVGCTNLYFTQGEACNLHGGEETHVASSTSSFLYYDSTCFVCPPDCPSASSPPTGSVCNVKAVSNGGTSIISYSSGDPIKSIAECGAACMATTGCTNLYFQSNTYCNLKAGTETHQSSSSSFYSFYEASCFDCATPSCTTDKQGLAVPRPSGAVCGVVAYSNGGTSVVSYSSGTPVESLLACSQACLVNSACTNLYYQAGAYCN